MSDAVWPTVSARLIEVQEEIAGRSRRARLWSMSEAPRMAGCAVAFAPGEAGPGQAGDRAWAAAVLWRPEGGQGQVRREWRTLRGRRPEGGPRQATDVEAQVVVAGVASASYAPGLLAAREGPVLAEALELLDPAPEVLMVDATGLDHPRRAGMAVHLGFALGRPSIGVTSRPLVAAGPQPLLLRGASAPVRIDDEVVGAWVCTRRGVKPIVAHAGWRTEVDTAVRLVLEASTEASRTPVPLQEARRVAREARALALGLWRPGQH
jgi:deoxyribonuclease V